MKKGWEKKRLGEVAELRGRIGWRGLTAKEYTAEGPLFLSVHALNYGDCVDFRDAFHISEQRYEESPEIMLQTNDVLICKDGAGIGKTGIVGNLPERATINSSLLLVRAGSSILPKFLYHCLGSPYFQSIVQSRLNGATTPHLYQRDIAEFPVVLPPLPEQRRIVAILDEAFEGIAAAKANAEKNLRNAREVFEGQQQAVFSHRGPEWEEQSLGNVAQFKNGLNYSKRSEGQTLPVVGVADFQDNYMVPLGRLEYATIDGDLAENYEIQQDDILTVRSNGSKQLVGRCMLVGDVDEVVSYSGFIIRIRFDTEVIAPRFLLHFMKCRATRDILTAGGGGANITNINQDKLSSLLVPLPPYDDQIAVVALLDSCRAETHGLENVYSRKLAALDELKAAVLHQAFTGQL